MTSEVRARTVTPKEVLSMLGEAALRVATAAVAAAGEAITILATTLTLAELTVRVMLSASA